MLKVPMQGQGKLYALFSALKMPGMSDERNDMTPRKWIFGFAVIVCLWLVGGAGRVQGADSELFEAAQFIHFPRAIPLPEGILPDPEGKNISLQSFKGQVVLMNFWTTW